jgi:hypothetical protein
MIAAPPGPDAGPDELARLGISRVATEHFLVGRYRYGNLADALAEAKRVRTPENDR